MLTGVTYWLPNFKFGERGVDGELVLNLVAEEDNLEHGPVLPELMATARGEIEAQEHVTHKFVQVCDQWSTLSSVSF